MTARYRATTHQSQPGPVHHLPGRNSGRTVTDTAHLAGFGSTETLWRAFVDHLGVSPKAYPDRFRTAARG
jgi:AraC-like DNA-binding protein